MPNAAVAAAVELGAGGLLLLGAVVVAALVTLRGSRGPAGFALVAGVVAIAVDSTFRGELLRDPLFWGVLGLTSMYSLAFWPSSVPSDTALRRMSPVAM